MREEEIRSASSGSKIDLDGSRRHGKKDAGEGQGKEGGREGRKGGREEGRIGPHRRLGFLLLLARAVMSRSLTVVGSAGTVGGTPDTALRRRCCCCQEVCLFHGRILLYLTSVL